MNASEHKSRCDDKYSSISNVIKNQGLGLGTIILFRHIERRVITYFQIKNPINIRYSPITSISPKLTFNHRPTGLTDSNHN
jgi:hypothetical protein